MSENKPQNFQNKTRADLSRPFIVMNTQIIAISLIGKKKLFCHIESYQRVFNNNLFYR